MHLVLGLEISFSIKKEAQELGEMAGSSPQAVKVQVDLKHLVPERKKRLKPNKTNGDLSKGHMDSTGRFSY